MPMPSEPQATACCKTTPNRPFWAGSVLVSFCGALFLSLDKNSAYSVFAMLNTEHRITPQEVRQYDA